MIMVGTPAWGQPLYVQAEEENSVVKNLHCHPYPQPQDFQSVLSRAGTNDQLDATIRHRASACARACAYACARARARAPFFLKPYLLTPFFLTPFCLNLFFELCLQSDLF